MRLREDIHGAGGGFEDAFADIDREIEALQEKLDRFGQAILLSRAAIWGGGIVLCLVLTIAGPYRTPVVVFGAFTVLLGGTVWFGANQSSKAEAEQDLAALEARKARLIDNLAARNGWRDITPTVH